MGTAAIYEDLTARVLATLTAYLESSVTPGRTSLARLVVRWLRPKRFNRSLVALLSVMLLLAGLWLRHSALLGMALPYLFFTLAPLWRAQPKAEWEVKRRIEPDQTWAGQPCRVRVLLSCSGNACLEELWIRDEIAQGIRVDGSPTYHGTVEVGGRCELTYAADGVRGRYDFAGVTIRSVDLLGLTQDETFISCPDHLFVLPTVERLREVRISPRRTRMYAGVIRSGESGTGVEFFGTRAYVPGDPLRHLNWKAGARWDLLITNLFEQERAADVGIILDARMIAEVRRGEESLFEHSVRAAASLAEYFLGQGNRVGLLVYGRLIHWTIPGYGKGQKAKILRSLVEAELGDHLVFKELKNLPTNLFPSESQIVLVSPLMAEDVYPLRYLRALGYRVLIVSPDPIPFERDDALARDECAVLAGRIARLEREITLARLRRGGVLVVDWDVTTPLWAPLKQSMGGRRR
jgi:uncharacterized protein (DUF58 family)